ncbi:MAG: hypothetical protein WAM53_09975 [Terrimicrobiaceae bacterium]
MTILWSRIREGRGTLSGIRPRNAPSLDPNAAENLRIITAATTQPPCFYDPRARRASRVDQYVTLMRKPTSEALPFTSTTVSRRL